MVSLGALGALALLTPLATTEPTAPRVEPVREDGGLALLCSRVVTANDDDRIFSPGMILVSDGKIEYVGRPTDVPDGYEVREMEEAWAAPGFVDIHTHVHTGGWGDINGSMLHVNPEFTVTPTMVPSNELVRVACASGVTTLFGIPGSGNSMGGFGVVYKAKTDSRFEDTILANPGGLKVAQSHNPDRNATSVLRSWAGLGWILEDINEKALDAIAEDRFDPQLENLKKVHKGELPVIVHCAGSDGVMNAVRMWRMTYPTRSFISHGSFDGYMLAEKVAEYDMPVNHGPRTIDWYSSRTGRIEPTAYHFWKAGGPNFSLNTDSQIVPQEEFFLQGAMAARQGADGYQMLRALTIHPARTLGLEARVGSLEVGKDADIVLWTGDPLDPRERVELVVIDGKIQYDRKKDGQWS